MRKPFPARCPECGAPRQPDTWRDPRTGEVVAEQTVAHEPGCSIYRERAYPRAERVVHVQAISIARRATA